MRPAIVLVTGADAEISAGTTLATAAATGNKILFAGGFDNAGNNTNSVDIYDVLTNTWSITNADDHFDDAADKTIRSCLNLAQPKSFFLYAGAGSGKTWSLVDAVRHVCLEQGRRLHDNAWGNDVRDLRV